jgi:hypothetical protein
MNTRDRDEADREYELGTAEREAQVTPQVMANLLLRIRPVLKRWCARYAGSDHAKRAVIESADLIAEIDALPLHYKE